MKYIKRFNESINEEYFSLTDKYNELPDDMIFPRTDGHDEWLKNTPTHIKLLSMLCGLLDADLVERFQLDNVFFDALENAYQYTGFKLTKDEVIESCHKLKEEGFLKYMKNLKTYEGLLDDVISGAKTSWKRNVMGTYKEPVFIWVFTNKGIPRIENKNLDSKVNTKIMDMLNDKFNLGFNKDKNGQYMSSIFKFDTSKLEEVSNYLTSLGLERSDFESEGCLFKGKLSIKNLK